MLIIIIKQTQIGFTVPDTVQSSACRWFWSPEPIYKHVRYPLHLTDGVTLEGRCRRPASWTPGTVPALTFPEGEGGGRGRVLPQQQTFDLQVTET